MPAYAERKIERSKVNVIEKPIYVKKPKIVQKRVPYEVVQYVEELEPVIKTEDVVRPTV